MADYAPPGLSGGGIVNGNLTVNGTIQTGSTVNAGNIRSTNNLISESEGQGGGVIQMQQSSAIQAAPTGTFVKLYTRVGTTGSKLVALSSTGVEYTILDNII